MNPQIGFYLMSRRGLYVLKKFTEDFGRDAISYVVSAPDPAVRDDPFEAIQQFAQVHGIDFYVKQAAVKQSSDVVMKFAVGWRWLIKEQEKLIVFHDSLLPKYRGFAPLVNCLINGDRITGVSAVYAADDYDKGEMIAQKSVTLNYPIKINDLIQQIEPVYHDLISGIFRKLVAGEQFVSVAQNEEAATYSPWLDSKDYSIDWAWSSEKIKRFVDAVGYPYDGAKVHVGERTYVVEEVDPVPDVHVEHRSRHIGKILAMKDGVPVVICGQGLLALKKIASVNGDASLINFRTRFLP